MSQFNAGYKAFESNATISKYSRVKLVSGKLEVAGSDEYAIGFAEDNSVAGDHATVKLINVAGTFKAIASEAITAGTDLYGAASGKVTDTDPGAGSIRFVALEAASGDNSVIEILPKSLA